MNFHNQVIFITGASSGIGEALAKAFAQEGAQVALAARRVDRLEDLSREINSSGGQTMALPCDVTKDGDLEKAVEAVRKQFGKIDIAVANAGFGVAGNFEKLKLEDYRRQFETNVFGVLRTLYATLEDLKKSKGTFVVMGSVSGHVSSPGISPYSMSKFAVRALAEALQAELEPLGVSVVLLSPGFVKTQIRKVDNQGVYKETRKDFAPAWLQMPADAAARKIVRAVFKKRREVVLTGHGKIGVFLSRHFPRFLKAVLRYSNARGMVRKNPAEQDKAKS